MMELVAKFMRRIDYETLLPPVCREMHIALDGRRLDEGKFRTVLCGVQKYALSEKKSKQL